METGLAVVQKNEMIARQSIPSDHEMMVFNTMAKQAVSSKMYKGIGDEAGVMMIMLSARELGISPMMALNGGLNIIQGKVEISARMMSALIRKSGHQISVKECTPLQCTLVGKRCDTGETQSASFSVAEAQLAGLVKPGGGWQKWPKDMCFARALSRLARQLFSDVIGIGYVEGEISQIDTPKITPEDTNPLMFEVEVIDEETEQQLTERFINLFDKEDAFLALEWLKVVQRHFEWTRKKTLEEMLRDTKKLNDKFNSWKSKLKKVEEEPHE